MASIAGDMLYIKAQLNTAFINQYDIRLPFYDKKICFKKRTKWRLKKSRYNMNMKHELEMFSF